MTGRRAHQLSLLLATALLVAGVSACSSGSTSGVSSGRGPELTHVTVGALEIPDAVTLRIAQQDGFFRQQGLTVSIVPLQAGAQAVPAMLGHTLDFGNLDYVSTYVAEHNAPALQLHVVADDLQAAPGEWAVMVPKRSNITSPAELKGKTMATPDPVGAISIGTLSTDALLNLYHLSLNNVTTATMAFPDEPEALARGRVASAFAVEPFVTIMKAAGGRPLADLMTGPMANFPVSCWVAPGWFVQHYPKTVAAFQRAIVKAQRIAAANTPLVRRLLPTYIQGLTAQIANVMALGTFNTTLSLTRMQRVADLMEEFHELPANFDVKAMYYPPPSGT